MSDERRADPPPPTRDSARDAQDSGLRTQDSGLVAQDLPLRERVLAYLATHNTVALATVDAEGMPWAATVFYVNLGTDLYFLSEPKTRHSQNILATKRVAGTVNEDYRDWQQIKGLQLEGQAEEVRNPLELARALGAYLDKYPFVRQFLSPANLLQGVKIGSKTFDIRLWRLRPTRLYSLDNARGFSAREELPL